MEPYDEHDDLYSTAHDCTSTDTFETTGELMNYILSNRDDFECTITVDEQSSAVHPSSPVPVVSTVHPSSHVPLVTTESLLGYILSHHDDYECTVTLVNEM